MSETPPVIVLIITYERRKIAVQTIQALKERLIYPNVGFHIADDGSRPGHIEALLDAIGPTYSVTISNARRGGVGKSMNLGIAACLKRADLVLHLEDDWYLKEPFDLTPCVRVLTERDTIGMVRLGYLSGYLAGTLVPIVDKLWWVLDRTKDHYTFSGHAALRHRRFYETYGLYREDLKPGQTEDDYCGRFERTKGPDIVWPGWYGDQGPFLHSGSSYSFKWYMENENLTAEEALTRMGDI